MNSIELLYSQWLGWILEFSFQHDYPVYSFLYIWGERLKWFNRDDGSVTSLTMSMIKETLIWLIRNPQLPNQIALAIGHSKKILRSNRISSCKFFVYFAQKNYFFLFYIPIFTKHPHQSIYSTYLFNKIFIILQFLIIFLTNYSSLS